MLNSFLTPHVQSTGNFTGSVFKLQPKSIHFPPYLSLKSSPLWSWIITMASHFIFHSPPYSLLLAQQMKRFFQRIKCHKAQKTHILCKKQTPKPLSWSTKSTLLDNLSCLFLYSHDWCFMCLLNRTSAQLQNFCTFCSQMYHLRLKWYLASKFSAKYTE